MTDKPQQPEDQQVDPQADSDAADSGLSKPDPGAASAEPAPPETSDAETSPDKTANAHATNTKAANAKTPGADRRSPVKKAANWFAFFLVLILLASVGGLSYHQWLQQQKFQETIAQINEQVEQQSTRLEAVSQSADRVQQEAEEAVRQMSQLSEQSQQQARQLEQQREQQAQRLEQQVSGLRERVQAISTTTSEDWKLAEAYYLTRLAGQRLLMERDTESALALLQAADEIARNYPDPDLYSVRQALSDDIAALRSADGVDREGLYLQIGALSRQLTELQVAEPLNYQPQPTTDVAAEPAPVEDEALGIWESIQQSFSRAMSKLEGFVRVSRHDEAPRPVADPERQLFLRSSLQTALDTAQLALLREQSSIYQASLEKALTLLTNLYAESALRRNFGEELKRLENIDIVQELPDISDSQEALGRYLEQRHRLAPQSNGAPADGAPEVQQ